MHLEIPNMELEIARMELEIGKWSNLSYFKTLKNTTFWELWKFRNISQNWMLPIHLCFSRR